MRRVRAACGVRRAACVRRAGCVGRGVWCVVGGQRKALVDAVVLVTGGEAGSGEEIIAHCRTLIAGYKLPRSVELRLEPLPVSGAGKILKTDLRKPYWAGRSKSVN